MTTTTLKMEFSITSMNPTQQLRKCLAQLSKSSRGSTAMCFKLTIGEVRVTPPILALLIQVLNHPLPKAPSDIESKWDHVLFYHCHFASGETSRSKRANVGGCCSPDERRQLGATIACRTSSLFMMDSLEILASLFTAPKLEIEKFHLDEAQLSTLECEGLGGLIQRCGSLKQLLLCSNVLQEPQMLVEPIGHAIHLQELLFKKSSRYTEWSPAVHDIVPRLLQNSQNQLQKLDMMSMNMHDCDFMAIVELLPTSRLAVLDVKDNLIHAQGILAFAAQLPRIKSLKKVVLKSNPWEHFSPEGQYKKCLIALLRGMLENYSIESLELTRVARDLEYCAHVNVIRSQILETGGSLPLGVWPWILEKMATRTWRDYDTWDDDLRFQKYMADSVYFVLQNSPLPSLIGFLPLPKRTTRKRNQVVRYY